jgi:small subunit ribosomal protein S3
MGNKVQADLYRLGVTHDWKSRWFGTKQNMADYLKQDETIRNVVSKHLPNAGISYVKVGRSPEDLHVTIYTSKAGMVIGRGGTGIDELKQKLQKAIGQKMDIKVTVEEVKNPNENAAIVAETIATQLEKRLPFRRVLKQNLNNVSQNYAVEGVRVALSGRLDGSEMSRSEYATEGKIPLTTIRADIDYAQKTAYTKYGTVGVKVWIYKGEKLSDYAQQRS